MVTVLLLRSLSLLTEQNELFIFLSLKHWEVESYRKSDIFIFHTISFLWVLTDHLNFLNFFFFKTTEETEMEQVASSSSVKMRPQFDEVGKKTESSSGLALFRNMHFVIRKKKGIKRMIWWPYS